MLTLQHIANMAWSYAFFRRPGTRIMAMVEDQVLDLNPQFTCVASTKVRILTREEVQLQARNLSEFKTGELSMIMWACAKYRHPSHLLYPLVSREFVRYFFFQKKKWVRAKYGHASNVLSPRSP
jgi:hypothetical protein